MSDVILTGGTGFIGRHLRYALQGEQVLLLGRRKPALLGNEHWSYLDMSKPVVPEKLAGGRVMCHLAYSVRAGRENTTYNRRLLEAVNARSEIKQMILMSSVSVYGASELPVVDEKSPCDPSGDYAETKLACEKVWLEGLREDCKLTVLRPTEVIGPGGKGLRSLIRDATERPFIGMLKRSLLHRRVLHYVAVSNVVAAVLFCLGRSQPSAQEIFIVSDDCQPENRSYAMMQDTVRKLSGRRPLPGPAMPLWMLQALGRITDRPLGIERVFCSRKLRDAGFEDAVSLHDEVACLVRSIKEAS
jgi:nucleoside-diphosphate-sugar epimerase